MKGDVQFKIRRKTRCIMRGKIINKMKRKMKGKTKGTPNGKIRCT